MLFLKLQSYKKEACVKAQLLFLKEFNFKSLKSLFLHLLKKASK
jgi:hypothetical protein